MTPLHGSLLLILASAAGAFALFVALTGGIDVQIGHLPVRSRSWERPAALAAMLAAAAAFCFRQELVAGSRQAGSWLRTQLERLGRVVPAASACAVLAAAIVYGAFVAGGADSYGYVSQAELLADGRLTDQLLMNPAFTWPDVRHTLTPLGYRLAAAPDRIAPSYPPGLPLLMAPLAALHSHAVFLLVPLCAALAVWLCYRLGVELGGPVTGRLSALLLAVSPTFLYQSMQPMSDVPAAAFWLMALLSSRHQGIRGAASAGLASAVAILIRPNLAPLALLVAAAAGWASGRLEPRRVMACAAGVLPGLLALGAIQEARFGSPLASGYGSLDYLFAAGNIVPNLQRYPRWLTETHAPLLWIWAPAPLVIPRMAGRLRPFAWVCYVFGLAVLAAYLPYGYFRWDEWHYTRFLLPAIPLFLIFTVRVLGEIADDLWFAGARPVFVALVLAWAGWLATASVRCGVFEIEQQERKYPLAGAFVRERLPESAVVLSAQHSGSVRYYAGRQTLRWDLLDPASLGQVLSDLRIAGYSAAAVLDGGEDVEFRKRFGARSAEAVSRMAPVGEVGSVRIYEFRAKGTAADSAPR